MKDRKSLIIKFVLLLLFGGVIVGLSVLFDTDLSDAFCLFDSDSGSGKRKRKKDKGEDEDLDRDGTVDEMSSEMIDDTKNEYRVDEL